MAVKTIIFDMDGVLYLGKKAIKGAKETIERLRNEKYELYFLTNAATRSRKGRAEKMRGLGIYIKEGEIITSSYGAAYYIKQNHPKSSVYVVGETGLKDELRNAGIKIVVHDRPDIVLCGLDRKVNYKKLKTAFRGLANGANFIATNMDPSFPVEDGLLPGAGACVSFLIHASGRKPTVIGKPCTYLIEMIFQESRSKKEEIMIVGDRVETDILLGKKCRIKTCLVLSGITTKKDLQKIKEKPDYVIESIADLDSVL
ncbi:HAD-IIA family hydrolase [Candidatus Micrarchaeota archaeon]|nr:HAD-IIA family hydrolase [Candidatus Micrarchaeota archaeon]